MSKFAGVAFDLDGTLYSNSRFYIRLAPFILRHWRLLLAMSRARKILHGSGKPAPEFPPETFYDVQARIMGEALGKDPEEVKKLAEKMIYRGWEPVFEKLPLFPYVRETLESFRAAGIRLALLSDFPPEKKLENFGIYRYWDVILCTEVIGRLKPDPLPFRVLAEKMALPPEKILYVGNSVRYDIQGAKNAGMSAARIRPSPFRNAARGGASGGRADFVFSGYRQLSAFVLQSEK